MSVIVKPYPTATTSKGLVVANFSSPHQFRFDDGTLLGSCRPDRANKGALEAIETELEGLKGSVDIELSFKLSQSVIEMLYEVCLDDDIDIVIVPLIVMKCVKYEGMMNQFQKLRSVRMADRVKKIAFHNRFCK